MPTRSLCSVSGCDNTGKIAKDFCPKHYVRWRKYGNPFGGRVFDGRPLEFLVEQLKSPTDECIIWPYSKAGRGYGVVIYQGVRHKVHRLALEMHLGRPLGPDLIAAHKPIVCHNPACFNPRHLREATKKQNSYDRILDKTDNRGARHKLAKLNEGQVRLIRNDPRPGSIIAKEYGITRAYVYQIRGRRAWTHVA